MAGFTVPNASEYGVTIQSLDQAEPDSLDFKILGNHSAGVITGCDITVFSISNGSATLTNGEVFVNNSFGTVTGDTLTFTAAGADARFDIVAVEKSGSSFIYTTIVGTSSATNPVFPEVSVNQLPLYAIYRKSGTTLNSTSVVDKRKFLNLAHRTGAAVPSTAADNGDLYIRTGAALLAEQSAVYVYVDSAWQNLAKYEGVREDPLHPFLFSGL
jgi:hypothetical protein